MIILQRNAPGSSQGGFRIQVWSWNFCSGIAWPACLLAVLIAVRGTEEQLGGVCEPLTCASYRVSRGELPDHESFNCLVCTWPNLSCLYLQVRATKLSGSATFFDIAEVVETAFPSFSLVKSCQSRSVVSFKLKCGQHGCSILSRHFCGTNERIYVDDDARQGVDVSLYRLFLIEVVQNRTWT